MNEAKKQVLFVALNNGAKGSLEKLTKKLLCKIAQKPENTLFKFVLAVVVLLELLENLAQKLVIVN